MDCVSFAYINSRMAYRKRYFFKENKKKLNSINAYTKDTIEYS